MSRHLYKLLLVLTPTLALASAIAGGLGALQTAIVLVALSVACVPMLLHMQTQRIVAISRTSESRLEKSLAKRIGKGIGVGTPTREATEQNDAIAQILTTLEGLKARTASDSLDSTANELRREARMTRLVITQLLEAQGHDATVPSSASAPNRGGIDVTSSGGRL